MRTEMRNAPTPEVLFVCTGNYYRSRFAEAVFNHLARERQSPWRAFSRGVAIHLAPPGLSPHTAAALAKRGISLDLTARERCQLAEADLQRAARRIALKEAEHRPYLRQLFPAWEDRVEYWHFHDLDFSTAELVLPEIEQRVAALLEALAATAG
ncbi:MAG TPA: low molecular weight phosphatase family protein [Opitutaceae bacterium]